MIKLQDFARQMGVTDRAIQKHLKKYAAELEGLYQRKGPNGTWLTEEACEILRNKMRQQPIAVADAKTVSEKEAAEAEAKRLSKELEAARKLITEMAQWKADNAMAIAAADQTKLLLESTKMELAQEKQAHADDNAANKLIIASKDAEIQEVRENAQQAVQDCQNAQQDAADQRQRAEDAEAQIRALKNRNLWERMTRKGE